MRHRLLFVGVALALSACAEYLPVDQAGDRTAAAPKTATQTPARGDTCGAGPLQYLVGKNKAEAPAPVDPSKRRVYCSTCTVTSDYRPDRVNIIFDESAGTITAVKCG